MSAPKHQKEKNTFRSRDNEKPFNPTREDSYDACRMLACGAQCADCPCGKRVLIVGGIERMETKYRQVIEKEGGILDYHSGNMQGGVKKLERCLQRADIVLCPVTCNSHGACSMVKRLGKKHKKPVHMMPSFSVNAIARAIGVEPATA